MEVVQKISETPVDDKGVATERVEIRHLTIRDTPPPVPEPFSTESAAELAAYRAVLETSAGPITIEVFPDKAPDACASVSPSGAGRRVRRHGFSSRRPGIRDPDRRAD